MTTSYTIPAMPNTQPTLLAQRTLTYWHLSRGWNGRGKSVSTEQALRALRRLTFSSNPAHKIVMRADELRHAIIEGKRSKKNQKQEPDHIRGTVVNLILLDEVGDINPETWNARK